MFFDAEGELFFNSHKIGYLFQGETLFKPKIFINNNHYLSQSAYVKILEKLDIEIKKQINLCFGLLKLYQ